MNWVILIIFIITALILLSIFISNNNKSCDNYENKSDKYVIYKGSGGMCHMLFSIQGTMEDCVKNRYNIIIDTRKLKSFDGDFFKYFEIVNFPKDLTYSGKYDNTEGKMYKGKELKYYNDCSLKFVSGTQYTVVNKNKDKLFDISSSKFLKEIKEGNDVAMVTHNMKPFSRNNKNYIRVRKDITKKIINRLPKELKNKKYIGVHYRNTDIKTPKEQVMKKILETSKKTGIKNVYFATDDFNAYENFKEELKEINFYRSCIPIKLENGKNNIHYGTEDKKKVVMDCLTDLYALIKCDEFVGSNTSGMTNFIKIDRYRKESIFY